MALFLAGRVVGENSAVAPAQPPAGVVPVSDESSQCARLRGLRLRAMLALLVVAAAATDLRVRSALVACLAGGAGRASGCSRRRGSSPASWRSSPACSTRRAARSGSVLHCSCASSRSRRCCGTARAPRSRRRAPPWSSCPPTRGHREGSCLVAETPPTAVAALERTQEGSSHRKLSLSLHGIHILERIRDQSEASRAAAHGVRGRRHRERGQHLQARAAHRRAAEAPAPRPRRERHAHGRGCLLCFLSRSLLLFAVLDLLTNFEPRKQNSRVKSGSILRVLYVQLLFVHSPKLLSSVSLFPFLDFRTKSRFFASFFHLLKINVQGTFRAPIHSTVRGRF